MTAETKNALEYLRLVWKHKFTDDDSVLEALDVLWDRMDEETHDRINLIVKEWVKDE